VHPVTALSNRTELTATNNDRQIEFRIMSCSFRHGSLASMAAPSHVTKDTPEQGNTWSEMPTASTAG
jgi:hypothetical protein